MDPQSFAYWLKGFVELNNGAMPTELQWKMIQDHLALVFHKVTPTYPETTPIPVWPTYTPSPFNNPYEITCSKDPSSNPIHYC